MTTLAISCTHTCLLSSTNKSIGWQSSSWCRRHIKLAACADDTYCLLTSAHSVFLCASAIKVVLSSPVRGACMGCVQSSSHQFTNRPALLTFGLVSADTTQHQSHTTPYIFELNRHTAPNLPHSTETPRCPAHSGSACCPELTPATQEAAVPPRAVPQAACRPTSAEWPANQHLPPPTPCSMPCAATA